MKERRLRASPRPLIFLRTNGRDRQRFIQLQNKTNGLLKRPHLQRREATIQRSGASFFFKEKQRLPSNPDAHDRQAGCRAQSGGCCHRHYCAPLLSQTTLFYEVKSESITRRGHRKVASSVKNDASPGL